MRAITLLSAGQRLSAHVFGSDAHESNRPGLLFIHGLRSGQDGYWPRAEAAVTELGAFSLTFDLRGHGQSTGTLDRLSLRDHLADVIVAYDRLVAEPAVDPQRIGVCGASYGGYLATLLTAQRPVRRLVLRAPALYEDADFDASRSRRPVSRDVPRHASRALGALGRFEGAVLIIESGRDDEVLPRTIQAYRDASPQAQHHLMPDALHGLSRPEWEQEFRMHLLSFFREL
jgi:uncharacterized protein